MMVSNTLDEIACLGIGNEAYMSLLEACDSEGFDLDDFLFEIWKETLYD